MKHMSVCSIKKTGVFISLTFHLFGLILIYFLQIRSGFSHSAGPSYAIKLASSSSIPPLAEKYKLPVNETDSLQPPPTLPPEEKIDNRGKNQPPVGTLPTRSKKKRSHSTAQLKVKQQSPKRASKRNVPQSIKDTKNPTIDERGLYHINKMPSKKAGVELELAGWEWDIAPNPKDTTEECGKIVFEIKIDENGEIISIQTIEKTISARVEKVYADALRELTFHKISESKPYSTISTGKVSFILVSK